MFGLTRWNTYDDIFNFHRDTDRLLNQFWNDLTAQSSRQQASPAPFQVHPIDDGWRVDVPMPGIDPRDVTLEAAGNTLTIRAERHGGNRDGEVRFEQSLTVPQFLDLEKITATHRHGMLELTLPLKDSVKPRRIQISGVTEDQKQLTTA
jgi:HSP20 family molecular chaperone IbpA